MAEQTDHFIENMIQNHFTGNERLDCLSIFCIEQDFAKQVIMAAKVIKYICSTIRQLLWLLKSLNTFAAAYVSYYG